MAEPRRRPKDRKAQIASVAAEAFSEQGYHAVSMDDIAHRVGVSAAALYRHSPSKYDLFRTAVLALSQQLVDATALPGEPAATEDEAAQTYDRLISALVDTALANRTRGGVYRWGGRYLVGDDLATLNSHVKLVNVRLQQPIRILRPDLGSQQRWTLSIGVLAAIGSIVEHRAALSAGRVHRLFDGMARSLLWAPLPTDPPPAADPPRPDGPVNAGRFEAVLREAMRLFLRNGYRQTTLDDIARAVAAQKAGQPPQFTDFAPIAPPLG